MPATPFLQNFPESCRQRQATLGVERDAIDSPKHGESHPSIDIAARKTRPQEPSAPARPALRSGHLRRIRACRDHFSTASSPKPPQLPTKSHAIETIDVAEAASSNDRPGSREFRGFARFGGQKRRPAEVDALRLSQTKGRFTRKDFKNRNISLLKRLSICSNRTVRGKNESADKPGSVLNSHSSGMLVAEHLERPTRIRCGPHHWIPIWPCSERGLPSHAMLPCVRCALTAPFHPYR